MFCMPLLVCFWLLLPSQIQCFYLSTLYDSLIFLVLWSLISTSHVIMTCLTQITWEIGSQSCKNFASEKILFAKFVLTLHMQCFGIFTATSLKNEHKCARHLSIMQMIAELELMKQLQLYRQINYKIATTGNILDTMCKRYFSFDL